MAENDNTFLNADNIYEEVEGEAGKNLSLEEDQQTNLVGILKADLLYQKKLVMAMKKMARYYENLEGYIINQ